MLILRAGRCKDTNVRMPDVSRFISEISLTLIVIIAPLPYDPNYSRVATATLIVARQERQACNRQPVKRVEDYGL